jgi:TolA-binding protein
MKEIREKSDKLEQELIEERRDFEKQQIKGTKKVISTASPLLAQREVVDFMRMQRIRDGRDAAENEEKAKVKRFEEDIRKLQTQSSQLDHDIKEYKRQKEIIRLHLKELYLTLMKNPPTQE